MRNKTGSSLGNDGTLGEIHSRYESLMSRGLSSADRDMELANLMTLMEREFRIPAMHNEQWESQNRKVIALYRILSQSREGIQ